MNLKIRGYVTLAFIVGLVQGGCSFGDDADALKENYYKTYPNDTFTGKDSADTTTRTDTFTDSEDTETLDSSTDTVADTVTQTDTQTETSTDTETVTLDSGSSTSVVDSDSTADSETVTTSVDTSDTGIETASETDTATLPVDTDTGTDCAGMIWDCGDGTNNMGFYLNCDASPGCADTGQICDTDFHECVDCDQDNMCGPSCLACADATPKCRAGLECVECLADGDCAVDSPVCDTDRNICVECVTNAHCRPSIGVVVIVDTETDTDTATDTATSTDTDTNTSTETDTQTETETETETTGPDTDTAYLVDTNKPWQSPLGVCTPDNNCSCWVETPDASATDKLDALKDECTDDSDCPSEEFRCLMDYYLWANPVPITHTSCLRICHSDWAGQILDGLECRSFGTVYAWVPMTTCFAYSRIGNLCSPGTDECRLSAEYGDGTCQENLDVFPATYNCTFSCWDDDAGVNNDEWCPNASQITDACANQNNYCRIE